MFLTFTFVFIRKFSIVTLFMLTFFFYVYNSYYSLLDIYFYIFFKRRRDPVKYLLIVLVVFKTDFSTFAFLVIFFSLSLLFLWEGE